MDGTVKLQARPDGERWQLPWVTATAVSKNFGAYQDAAVREPVIITKNGRPPTVLIAYEDYLRLAKQDRRAEATAVLSDVDIDAVEQTIRFDKSKRAEELVKVRGDWLLFLPPYPSDLNPIKMVFSQLKTLLRKRAARSFDATAQALGDICSLFCLTECRDYSKATGHEVD